MMCCGKCGKKCETGLELVTHDCPKQPVTQDELDEFARMIDENMKKILEATKTSLTFIASAVDDLRKRVDALETK
jgi:arsenate reductase-like glutaredoxin family protein